MSLREIIGKLNIFISISLRSIQTTVDYSKRIEIRFCYEYPYYEENYKF